MMSNMERTNARVGEPRNPKAAPLTVLRPISRTMTFIVFLIIEYLRSGRIVIELLVGVMFFAIFLRGAEGMDAEKFFTMSGIFTLALMIYTMSSVLGLADRPQSYMLLSRRLDRAGYLLGVYFQAVLIVASIYLFISIITLVISRPTDLNLARWVGGSVPLLLNIGLLSALLLMLSPLVFSTGWRLFVLALIALAFSGNFFTGPVIALVPDVLQGILSSLQTILSWPLVPAFSGFALMQNQQYDTHGLVIVLAQCSLLVALLSLSVYSFSRRDLMFSLE
jgi:hypothetical protein